MQSETGFKFEPIWLTTLTALVVYLSFQFLHVFFGKISYGLIGLFLLIIPALCCWFVLPMTIAMLMRKPAIALTSNYLIDNIGGFIIDWHDIDEIRVTEKGHRAGGNLIINLKQPEKYFNTPLKSIGYKIRQFFTAADISIKLDFVAGKNDKIAQMVNAYWFNNTREMHMI